MFEEIMDKLQARVALADGGEVIAKRGLVDGPGGYSGETGIVFEDFFSPAKKEKTKGAKKFLKSMSKGTSEYWPFKSNKVFIDQIDIDNATKVRNYILANKGFVANIEEILENALDDDKGRNRGLGHRALVVAKDSFPEIKNFKFLQDIYPGVPQRRWKIIKPMAQNALKHLQSADQNLDESLSYLLPENIRSESDYNLKVKELRTSGSAARIVLYNNLNKAEKDFLKKYVSTFNNKTFSDADFDELVKTQIKIRNNVGTRQRLLKTMKTINDEIYKLSQDKKLNNILSNENYTRKLGKEALDRAAKVLKTEDLTYASRRIFMLGEALQNNDVRNVPNVKVNPKIGNKIVGTQFAKQRYAFPGLLYTHYSKLIDRTFNTPIGKSFEGYYQQKIKNLLDKGQSPDEVFSLRASGRRGLAPYAIFTQGLKSHLNEAVKGAFIDSSLSTTHRDIQNIMRGRKFNTLSKAEQLQIRQILKDHDTVVSDTIKKFPELKKYKYITSANFDFVNPPEKSIANFDKRFENNPEIKKAFQDSYKKVGYSMKVPKEFLTQKEYLKKFSGQKGLSTVPVLLATLGGTLLTGAALAGVPKTSNVSPPKEVSPTSQTTGPGVETAVGAGAAGAAFVPKVRESVGEFVQKIPKPVRTVGGFLLKRALPPIFLGTSIYDVGKKSQYETPAELATTVVQQPLDYLGLGFLAEQAKENLRRRRYASPEELKQLNQGLGIYDYNEIPSSQTDRDALIRMLDERAKRMEFGQAGEFNPYQIDSYQDTGDEPIERIPEATKRFLDREIGFTENLKNINQGLGSLEDIYGYGP